MKTNLPCRRDSGRGGLTKDFRVAKSNFPVLDGFFNCQYLFSSSVISDSST